MSKGRTLGTVESCDPQPGVGTPGEAPARAGAIKGAVASGTPR
jgi:hypothetical protein